MDTDKIVQELNTRFAAPLPEFYKRRIIFWHDEEREFEDKLDEIVLDNAFLLYPFLKEMEKDDFSYEVSRKLEQRKGEFDEMLQKRLNRFKLDD